MIQQERGKNLGKTKNSFKQFKKKKKKKSKVNFIVVLMGP